MSNKILKIQFGTTEKKDAEVSFEMLRPSDSLKFLLYLSKLLGGAMGNAIAAFSLGDRDALNRVFDGDFDLSKIGNAIPIILGRIEEKETLEKVGIILSSVRHNGVQLDLDYFIFDGRPDLLFKILKEALDHNYRFFLTESTGLLDKLAASKDVILDSLKQSKTQASTGSSGGQ